MWIFPIQSNPIDVRFDTLFFHHRRSASSIRFHPHRILSSLPNLISNELNQVSREHCQISLSVPCENEKSRSTRCSKHYLISIIDDDFGDKILNISVFVLVILLELWRKSGIGAQIQTKRELATITDNVLEFQRGLTYQVPLDCSSKPATIPAGCR